MWIATAAMAAQGVQPVALRAGVGTSFGQFGVGPSASVEAVSLAEKWVLGGRFDATRRQLLAWPMRVDHPRHTGA